MPRHRTKMAKTDIVFPFGSFLRATAPGCKHQVPDKRGNAWRLFWMFSLPSCFLFAWARSKATRRRRVIDDKKLALDVGQPRYLPVFPILPLTIHLNKLPSVLAISQTERGVVARRTNFPPCNKPKKELSTSVIRNNCVLTQTRCLFCRPGQSRLANSGVWPGEDIWNMKTPEKIAGNEW